MAAVAKVDPGGSLKAVGLGDGWRMVRETIHKMSNPASNNPQSTIRNPAIPWSLAAAVLYGVFAAYLYRPHVEALTGWRWLLPASAGGPPSADTS